MANNNESSPQKEELVKVEAEKDVIESSATHSQSTRLVLLKRNRREWSTVVCCNHTFPYCAWYGWRRLLVLHAATVGI